jgi:hypothetical protein
VPVISDLLDAGNASPNKPRIAPVEANPIATAKQEGNDKAIISKASPLQPANQKRLCSLDLLRLEPADKLQSRRPEQQSKRFSSQLGIVAE